MGISEVNFYDFTPPHLPPHLLLKLFLSAYFNAVTEVAQKEIFDMPDQPKF